MLPTSALDYALPEELIATRPAQPRDSARLLVVSRSRPDLLEHRAFRDLAGLLAPGDLLVVNATRVMPARFLCVRADSSGRGEGLYIGPAPHAASDGALMWQVLLKLRRTSEGARVRLLTAEGTPGDVELELTMPHPDSGWIVRVHASEPVTIGGSDDARTRLVLDRVGLTPVPPYILSARKRASTRVDDDDDRREYQTVFAHDAEGASAQRETPRGSIAAPTAGLHFTPELLQRLSARGVLRLEVMLDVGLGTFKPVEAEHVEQHAMHAEFCCVPPATARAIAELRADDGRARDSAATAARQQLIAVGTTAARTLESFATIDELLRLGPPGKHTRLLITPGFSWQHCDGLITNFHLPRTTLLAMVASRLQPDGEPDLRAGVERMQAIYRIAVQERYRFYSFGDAMLILP
jgi:S-adenosylmethionine:tRNA ribosyltransferase-isomerase